MTKRMKHMESDDMPETLEPLEHEGIESIRELTERATEPRTLDLAGVGGPRKLLVITKDGKQEYDLTNTRGHQIENIDDLCDLAKRIGKQATLWHDASQIAVCFEDDKRFDRASMDLQMDSRFKAVVALGSGEFKHAAFVRLLRIKLDSAVQRTVVDMFESIKFNIDSESEARATRQSIGKRALAATAGVGEIPSEITITTPVYSEAQIPDQPMATIRCMIEIDAAEAKFYITPIERDIELAKMAVARHIHTRLVEHTKECKEIVGVYQGRP